MAIVTARYWECDVCGYRWPYVEGIQPKQCRSKKCRTRRFDHKNQNVEQKLIPTRPNWDAVYRGTRP